MTQLTQKGQTEAEEHILSFTHLYCEPSPSPFSPPTVTEHSVLFRYLLITRCQLPEVEVTNYSYSDYLDVFASSFEKKAVYFYCSFVLIPVVLLVIE